MVAKGEICEIREDGFNGRPVCHNCLGCVLAFPPNPRESDSALLIGPVMLFPSSFGWFVYSEERISVKDYCRMVLSV